MPSNADSVRFWSKVAHGRPEDCWDWTGHVNADGYGVFNVDRRPVRAHRYAWWSVRGPIPEGMQLDHLCRNRSCVNPHHLEVVTNRENVLRGEGPTAQLARKTHCVRGHELSGNNLAIDTRGYRRCRACKALWQREKGLTGGQRRKLAREYVALQSEATATGERDA